MAAHIQAHGPVNSGPAVPDELKSIAELQRAGQLNEARRACAEILRQNPSNGHASLMFGILLQQLGDYASSVNYLRTARKMLPRRLEPLFYLGVALHQTGCLEEAAACLQNAARLYPKVAEVHNYLGIVKAARNQDSAALAHFQTALRLAPEFAEAHRNLGSFHAERGRMDEARVCFERAIRYRPDYGMAWWQLVSTRRISRCDDVVEAMEPRFTDPSVADSDKVGLAFALGKAFHDLGQHDKAFDYWLAGNRLKRSLSPYDIDCALSEMRQIRKAFPRSAKAPGHRSADTTVTPLFIIGMPRSGTSLAEQILASHPQVHGGGEIPLLNLLLRNAVRDFPQGFRKLDQRDWEALAQTYLQQLPAHPPTVKYVTDKLPANFLHVGAIQCMFPDAKIVHCTRNPMAIGLSCFRQHFVAADLGYTCDLRELGAYYRAYRTVMDHWYSVYADKVYRARYEALIREPETEIHRLLEFCELPFEPACLRFDLNTRSVKTASFAQVRQPIYRSSLETWRLYERQLEPLRLALERNSRSALISLLSSPLRWLRGR